MEENQMKFSVRNSDYTLEISSELEKKIRYLCNKFPQREWSGVLFYEYTGAFSSDDIKFIAKDFLYMDEGDATSTEFNLDGPDVVGYMCDNDLFGCQTGLLHSHQSFKAFFSGQDDSMLKQEGAKRNHFLSLVVNNAREYVARITCKETYNYTIEGTSTFKTFNDVAAQRPVKEEREQVAVIAYDLKIEYPNVVNEYKELDERIEEIKKKKEEEKKEKATQVFPFSQKYNNAWAYDKSYEEYLGKDSQTSIWPYQKQSTPTVKQITKEIETKSPSTNFILTDEECGKYAAQLIKLDMLAEEKDIAPFLYKMEKELDKRFDTIGDYKDVLHLFADEILDYELGGQLIGLQPEDDVDALLADIKLEIASYIEEKTKGRGNKYIELVIEYLYA